MLHLTSALKWIAAFLVMIVWRLSSFVINLYSTPRKTFEYSKFLMRCIYGAMGIRTKISGLENVKKNGVYVIMANHRSAMDHMVIGGNLPVFTLGIEKASNHKIPVYGGISRWWGNVALEREDRRKAFRAIDKATQKIKEGYSMLIMPEGSRSKGDSMLPFKKGGFHMAVRSGVPVIPISLVGMREINPDRKFLCRSGTVKMIVHPPVSPEGLDAVQLLQKVEAMIASVEGIHKHQA